MFAILGLPCNYRVFSLNKIVIWILIIPKIQKLYISSSQSLILSRRIRCVISNKIPFRPVLPFSNMSQKKKVGHYHIQFAELDNKEDFS